MTNYILGIILCLIGIFSAFVIVFTPPDSVVFGVWMGIMTVIWFSRLIYHLKYPLGKALKIYFPMSAVFLLAALCFLEGLLVFLLN